MKMGINTQPQLSVNPIITRTNCILNLMKIHLSKLILVESGKLPARFIIQIILIMKPVILQAEV